ncbi:olfactory receptor 2W1-like [Gastrophryne carolinensis]
MFSLILKEGGTISWIGCIAQFYFYTTTEGAECLLLAVMSYDRYLAICNPLHYSTIANPIFCIKTVIATCLVSVFLTVMLSISMNKASFCGANIIDHFFCDLTMLLEFACSDISVIRNEIFFICVFLFISPLLVIVVSYVYIALCIARMPTITGRKKAFSTCSSHLTVVWLFYGSLISIYMVPKRGNLSILNKMLSLFYTTITPMLNPIIYSLRNKEFRASFKKMMSLNIYW